MFARNCLIIQCALESLTLNMLATDAGEVDDDDVDDDDDDGDVGTDFCNP